MSILWDAYKPTLCWYAGLKRLNVVILFFSSFDTQSVHSLSKKGFPIGITKTTIILEMWKYNELVNCERQVNILDGGYYYNDHIQNAKLSFCPSDDRSFVFFLVPAF